jgi:short-subunit dehydrogenase
MAETFASKYGPWAVVAGASEGLGAAFAEALAARGVNLCLVARRTELLERLAERLRASRGIDVRIAACDLARPDLADTLEQITSNLEIGLGIYNAAYAPVGAFAEQKLENLLRIIDVNVRGPVVFARTLAPKMAERGRGGLILMSSLAGLQGAPRIAAYAASKAFNSILGEGLWAELKPKGVDVVVACAGAIRTPGYAKTVKRDAAGVMDARAVAEETLNGLGRGPVVVPGRFNRFARFMMSRVLSRRAAISAMARSTKEFS